MKNDKKEHYNQDAQKQWLRKWKEGREKHIYRETILGIIKSYEKPGKQEYNGATS